MCLISIPCRLLTPKRFDTKPIESQPVEIRRNRIKPRKAPWLKPLPAAAVGLKVTLMAVQYGFYHLNIEVPALPLCREILQVRKRIEKILAKHTGRSLERIRTDTERDYFMSACDAVEYGLIDDIREHRESLPDD